LKFAGRDRCSEEGSAAYQRRSFGIIATLFQIGAGLTDRLLGCLFIVISFSLLTWIFK
jgi:hypothetical protein